MAKVTFKGNPVHTAGELPRKGDKAPEFVLVKPDLSELKSESLRGKRVVLNIFPSLDTPVCATSVRKFNQLAAKMADTVVVAVSKDLPFTHQRFCTTEGIDQVTGASAFRNTDFGRSYGVEISDSPLAGLFARAVVVLDKDGRVMYEELVPEISSEPDYDAALSVLE